MTLKQSNLVWKTIYTLENNGLLCFRNKIQEMIKKCKKFFKFAKKRKAFHHKIQILVLFNKLNKFKE